MEKRNLLKKALTLALVLIMTLGCASTAMARSFGGDEWDATIIGRNIFVAVVDRKGDYNCTCNGEKCNLEYFERGEHDYFDNKDDEDLVCRLCEKLSDKKYSIVCKFIFKLKVDHEADIVFTNDYIKDTRRFVAFYYNADKGSWDSIENVKQQSNTLTFGVPKGGPIAIFEQHNDKTKEELAESADEKYGQANWSIFNGIKPVEDPKTGEYIPYKGNNCEIYSYEFDYPDGEEIDEEEDKWYTSTKSFRAQHPNAGAGKIEHYSILTADEFADEIQILSDKISSKKIYKIYWYKAGYWDNHYHSFHKGEWIESTPSKIEDGVLTFNKFQNGLAFLIYEADIPVKGVSLDQTELHLYSGDNASLSAEVTPSDATNKNITWTSSNPAVATVDANGKVTGIGEGTATITATTVDNGKTATCLASVKVRTDVTAKTIRLKKTSLTMNYNDAPLQLEIKTLNPANADVFWKSEKENIATVDAFGFVTPHAEGKAKITAYGKNDKVKATCTITVKGPEKPKSVTIQKINKDNRITKGKTVFLKATVKPATANQAVKWSFAKDPKGMATINPETGEFKCLGGGDFKVQAETVLGNKKATMVIKGPKALKGIKISKTSIKIDQDKEKTLTISPNPKEAELEGEVIWTSDHPEIARVVGTGNTATVYGVKGGTAKVTASVGGKSKTCKITVKGPIYVEGVSLNKTEVTLKQGKNVTLKPKFKPTKPTNKNVTWTSSDTNVATVSTKGKVVAVNPGVATITVKTADGGFTATSTITVVENTKKK